MQNVKPEREHGRFYYILKGVGTSLFITVPVFLLLALSIKLTDFPEEYLSPAVFATVVLSIVAAGFLSTVSAADRGWFNGCIVGFLYMMIAVCLRWKIEGAVSFSRDILTMLLTGLLIGSISGMAGLNLGIRLRRRKNAPSSRTSAHNVRKRPAPEPGQPRKPQSL